MKVLIAAEYEANYLTIGGIPVHVGPEIVKAAQDEAQALVYALAREEAERAYKDQGPGEELVETQAEGVHQELNVPPTDEVSA